MPRSRCRHAGMHPSSTDRSAFLASLPRWLAINQHASMPACQHASKPRSRCRQAGVHANSYRQTSILGLPPSLAGHQPACQHTSMPQLGVPACWHAGVYASTGMPSIRGCTHGCWPCGHSPVHGHNILIAHSLHLSGDQQKAHMAQHTELAHENPPCDLPGADNARDRWYTN